MATSISASVFVEHFRRAWLGARGIVQHSRTLLPNGSVQLPRKIGLAVSGGADSMALAYLCRQLELSSEHSTVGGSFSVTGFVVDHRAREESSREASTVAGWLQDLGIKTQILELDWSPFSSDGVPTPGSTQLSMPTAFETYARQLRFQALGKACREGGIETLLMGHHRDDSIETALWRLATGAGHAGLGGIQEVARFPECHGLFGVFESGSSINLRVNDRGLSPHPHVRLNEKNEGRVSFVSDVPKKEASIATGGILLCRPLLAFPKTMLLETCHENKVPYVTDPTNFDPTLTPRNAIRSMLMSNSMPRALQPASVLSLLTSSKALLKLSDQFSNAILESRCRILDFNFQTGVMVIQFLQTPESFDPLLASNSPTRLRQIQSLTLRRITELVSPFPRNHFYLRSFEQGVSRIFHLPPKDHDGKEIQPRPFTLGGVMLSPLTMNESSPEDFKSRPLENGKVWMFSRQPFSKNRLPVSRVELPLPSRNQSSQMPSFSPWTLWDDRFWLRFSLTKIERGKEGTHSQSDETRHAPRSIPLVIRPFQKSDLDMIRHHLGQKKGKKEAMRLLGQLKQVLLNDAPGGTRFTIPVLGYESSTEAGQIEQLLVLPTLDFCLSGSKRSVGHKRMKMDISYEGQRWKLGWEWMYKMIDTGALRLMEEPV